MNNLMRTLPFESEIIARYRRRQSSVEESLVEMYLAGVSVRRVEDITAAQRCVVHHYRNVMSVVPRGRIKDVMAMLKAIHAQEDRAAAATKAVLVAEKLEAIKLGQAAELVRTGVAETLSYMAFPREHWTRFRTNNVLERLMREIRPRTRVVGNFPDGRSALMLVAARLRHVTGTKWGSRRYIDMDRLDGNRNSRRECVTAARRGNPCHS